MEIEMKPQCGGGGIGAAEYDLPLHTIALFLVLFASIGGAGFPVMAKKIKWMKIPPKVFFFCKHFGTGVLIATAFIHLIPTAFQSLNDPCLPDLFTKQYPPIPGAIMMFAVFALFMVEMWLNAKTGGHSHGGPTGEGLTGNVAPIAVSKSIESRLSTSYWYAADEKNKDMFITQKELTNHNSNSFEDTTNQSEMPAWFIVFYSQYIRQREEMMHMIKRYTPTLPAYPSSSSSSIADPKSSFDANIEADLKSDAVNPLLLQKMSLQITLIEGGILFHSVFVGMTVSITVDGFIVLLIAILFHQTFEGLGLGSRIAAVPYPRDSFKPWALVVAFGTTAPIGMAIGLATRSSYDPNSAFALILVGMFNAFSSGLLLYAALVDLLAEDFLSDEANRVLRKKDKTVAFIYVLLGAMGMGVVGAFA